MRSLGLVVFGQGLQSLTSFATGVAVGRFAGQDELGIYALSLSFAFLAVSLGDTLIATPYTYFKADKKQATEKIFVVAFLLSFLLVLLLAMMFVGLQLSLLKSLRSVLLVVPLILLVFVLREFMRRHFYALGAEWASCKFDVLACVLQVVLVGVLLLFDQLNAVSGLLAIALAVALAFISVTRPSMAILKQLTLHELVGWALRFWSYGRWLVVGGVCHVLGVQLYPWLAMADGGAAQVGLFTACMALANLVNPLLVSLSNYFRPRFMQAYRQLSPPVFIRYVFVRLPLFFVPALVFASALYVWAAEILRLFYGAAYMSGSAALCWLLLGLLAVAFAAPLQLALLAAGAAVTNFIYQGSMLFILSFAALMLAGQLSLGVLAALYALVNIMGALILLAMFVWVLVVGERRVSVAEVSP